MCIFFFSSRRRHTRCALVTGVQTCALPIFALAMPLVLSVFAPDAAAQSEAQPAAVAGSELTRTSGALERLDDVDTLLSLTSEGALLYENDEVKLDGYQYCSQAVALAERGELRR